MGSNRTISKKSSAAKKPAAKKTTTKKAPKEKVEVKPQGPRHPRGRVTERHGGKEALAKALASSLAAADENTDGIVERLKTASNKQLLRLQRVVETVQKKWGSRDKLIEAIANSTKAGKDKDYVEKLSKFSLPRLVDLANSAERRARA